MKNTGKKNIDMSELFLAPIKIDLEHGKIQGRNNCPIIKVFGDIALTVARAEKGCVKLMTISQLSDVESVETCVKAAFDNSVSGYDKNSITEDMKGMLFESPIKFCREYDDTKYHVGNAYALLMYPGFIDYLTEKFGKYIIVPLTGYSFRVVPVTTEDETADVERWREYLRKNDGFSFGVILIDEIGVREYFE